MSALDTHMASSLALKAAKKELRFLMKQRLSKVTAESMDTQSAVLFDSLTRLRGYQDSKRIGIYLSMPSGEIQTDAIVRHALGSEKQVFIPYLHKSPSPSSETPKSVMDMVKLHSLTDYESLKRDSWGIPTIPSDTVGKREKILENSGTPWLGLDIILLPGVAFDIDPQTGSVRRLGHGRGFYDYFLHRYQQNELGRKAKVLDPAPDVLLYGLALKEQFLEAGTDQLVPVGEHDHSLHGLLLGNGTIVEGSVSRG